MLYARATPILLFALILTGIAAAGQSIWSEGTSCMGLETSTTYHTSYEITSALRELVEQEPDILNLTTAQEDLSVREVIGGREIPILTIGAPGEERQGVLLIGAHHGDEPDSAECLLAFSRYMVDGYEAGDPVCTAIIGSVNVYVLPVVNPYGLDMGTRTDENGEDPNRDYPFSPEGLTSTSDGTPLTTAGAQTVHRLAVERSISIALSFHSGSLGVYMPWGAAGTGNVTPDDICFSDMGKVLSKASGHDIPYGPANDFTGLGYLKGAFDDHIYGSMFMPEMLDSGSNRLPGSSFAATVELGTFKGRHPQYLGTIEGVNDPGGESDGTVPMGTRISLAACLMASPSITGNASLYGDNLNVSIAVSGAEEVRGLSCSVSDGMGTPIELVPTEVHPFLPIRGWSSSTGKDAAAGGALLSASCIADPDWVEHAPGSEPAIGPQSLLSRSRGIPGHTARLQWDAFIEPSQPVAIADIGVVSVPSDIVPVGGYLDAVLDIELEGESPLGMTITSSVEDDSATTDYGKDEISEGTSSYTFLNPLVEGPATVDIVLTTDKGERTASFRVRVHPRIYITGYQRIDVDHDMFRFIIGVDGGRGPTSVLYGISRSLDEGWDGNGWVVGPSLLISPGFGPLTVDVNLSHFGGVLYFRTANFPGSVESVQVLDMDMDLYDLRLSAELSGSGMVVGPIITFYAGNGAIQVDPSKHVAECELTIVGPWPEGMRTYRPTWVQKEDLSPEMLADIEAGMVSMRIGGAIIEGAWYLILSEDLDPGTYTIECNVSFTVLVEGTERYTTPHISKGPVVVTVPGEANDEKEDVPWAILIFLVAAASVLLLVTILRYSSHYKEPQPDEEQADPFGGIGRMDSNRSGKGTRRPGSGRIMEGSRQGPGSRVTASSLLEQMR